MRSKTGMKPQSVYSLFTLSQNPTMATRQLSVSLLTPTHHSLKGVSQFKDG